MNEGSPPPNRHQPSSSSVSATPAALAGTWDLDLTTGRIRISSGHAILLGWETSRREAHLDELLEQVHPEDRGAVVRTMQADAASDKELLCTYRALLPDGRTTLLRSVGRVLYDASGAPGRVVGSACDVSAERELARAVDQARRLNSLTRRISSVFLRASAEDMFAEILALVQQMLDSQYGYFGYIDEEGSLRCPSMTRGVWTQCELPDKSVVFPREQWGGLWGRSLVEQRSLYANDGLRLPEGHVLLRSALVVPIVHRGRLIGQFAVADKPGGYGEEDREALEQVAAQTAPVLVAALERQRHEDKRERLERQLAQAQRLESIGRLAGGVAHDFNNMLAAIILQAELTLDTLSPTDECREAMSEIAETAHRSAELTKQLLAFARRQPIAPKRLDINTVVEGTLKMLNRTLGEEIQLVWRPGKNVGLVEVDPSQMDQVLLNLCINARDAIRGGGHIEVSTERIELTENASFASDVSAHPGPYVRLSLTDDGCGMNEDTLRQVFDPFFTTKGKAAGTGLGLSMVYGIVAQNHGFIDVTSTPGEGTTFSIYLPCVTMSLPAVDPASERPAAMGGSATILLVEDEQTVLRPTQRILESLGYRVIACSSADTALRVAHDHAGPIDLLLTDVVMPGMSGRELQMRVCEIHPDIRYLFMSGYSENVITEHGVLKETQFIQKPFSLATLASRIRHLLDKK